MPNALPESSLLSIQEIKAEAKKILTKHFYSAPSAKPFKKKRCPFSKAALWLHSHSDKAHRHTLWCFCDRGKHLMTGWKSSTRIHPNKRSVQPSFMSFINAQVPIKLGKCHRWDHIRYNSDWMSKKLEWKEIKSKYTGWSLSSIKHFYSCRKTEPFNAEF